MAEYPNIYYKIIDGDYEEIKKYFSSEDINKPIEYKDSYELRGKINEYTGHILPVSIAVVNNNIEVLKYLLSIGAVLPDDILTRAKQPQMIRELYNLGGNINYCYENSEKSLYGYCSTFEQMVTLYELGLDVKKYGAHALNSYDYFYGMKNNFDKESDLFKRFDFLIKHGADINYEEKDSLKWNLLIKASYYGNMDLVKYLIENGADVKITDATGKRAYNWAVYEEHYEIAEYLKSLEPKEFHDIDKKIELFKKFSCPDSMIEFFMNKDIVINTKLGYLKLLYITNTYVLDYDNHKFIVLSAKNENYGEFMILWSEDLKSICSLDFEHGVLTRHCYWEEFYSDMPKYIENAIKWEGEHIGDWVLASDENGNTPKGDIYWEDL